MRLAGDGNPADAEFRALQPRLLGLAYRMLGSMWDAEDVVAEAMVRWMRADRATVREPAAFLTTVVTRLALDQLRSARARRETYPGPWLPEPVPSDALDPLETVVGRETLSLATLRLMEELSPPERAVFVLREAFELPYGEIAEILELGSEGAARVVGHRARRRLELSGTPAHPADPSEHAALFARLEQAIGTGDRAELEQLLAADVVAYSDGGGKARAARRPLEGRDRVVRFIEALVRRFGSASAVSFVSVGGVPARLATVGGQRQLTALDVREGRITALLTVMNPDKLRWVEATGPVQGTLRPSHE